MSAGRIPGLQLSGLEPLLDLLHSRPWDRGLLPGQGMRVCQRERGQWLRGQPCPLSTTRSDVPLVAPLE